MNSKNFASEEGSLSADLVVIRRELHKHPELSFQERKTAALVCRELDRLHIPHTKIAGTGVRAVLQRRLPNSSAKTPCVALRADMDGLPVYEKPNLDYASVNNGVMHACGHDGHVAMLIGAAKLLREQEFHGDIVLLFQPAEEAGNGAARMVEEKALAGVDMIFAGHIDTHFQTGDFTVDKGLICSHVDPFHIRIQGRGGHAARPHEAIESVVLASNLVMNMQTLVSRQINPSHAAVVTVGRLQAGTVLNAIAESAVLEGTIRSAHPAIRKSLRKALRRLIQGVQEMSNAIIELDSERFVLQKTAIIQEVERLREKGIITPERIAHFFGSGQIDQSLASIRLFSRGTTHVSVADKEGNVASMTCSNGEGSGYVAPGTGIMLNNMMGEDDLHPDGFHSSPPGQRVGSMMAPSLLIGEDEVVGLVIGSGGSKRIRTAITQVLTRLIDHGQEIQEAVDAPRLYWDENVLQMEPGFHREVVAGVGKQVSVNRWQEKSVYFGGVHAVVPGKSGAGDPRRGGAVRVVEG